MKPSPAESTRPLVAGTICPAILTGMLIGHAWPLWTGRTIVLRAQPVDPRDLFRGEFVRLDTPLTNVVTGVDGCPPAGALVLPIVGDWPVGDLVGQVVYVQLEARGDLSAPGKPAEYSGISISARPVDGALNLRGRVTSRAWSHRNHLTITYGLDAFFMQEGTARSVEDAMRAGKRVQMEVAIGSSGRARIRNLIVEGAPLPR